MKQFTTRNKIIETAAHLFYKSGYNSTGINEIISQAGIAKATLYSHFKSKEELCIEYLRFKDASFIQNIESFATSQSEGKDQVLAIFDFLESFYQSESFNGCWCIKTVSEIPNDNEAIRSEIQKLKNNFIQLISRLIADNLNVDSDEEINSLARKIYLLYESAVSESHLHNEIWPISETKIVCETLI